MGIKDIAKLSKEPNVGAATSVASLTDPDTFGPAIVHVLVDLINEITDVCASRNVDLSSIDAFNLQNNEWHMSIMQTYENLYFSDCMRLRKQKH